MARDVRVAHEPRFTSVTGPSRAAYAPLRTEAIEAADAMKGTTMSDAKQEARSFSLGQTMTRRRSLALALGGGATLALGAAPLTHAKAESLTVEGFMPALSVSSQWLNSPPLTREGLRGKVVLIDFWTYSCINCQRTLPYVRAWSDKYHDRGLTVIGVHTPEFAYEKEIANVRSAVARNGIAYPVAIDNDYENWRAYKNEYWPAFYFIDAIGRIRHHHFGEGEYDRAERVIELLLAEAGRANAPS